MSYATKKQVLLLFAFQCLLVSETKRRTVPSSGYGSESLYFDLP